MKAKKKINNGNLSYPVFDGIEDHAINVPLKLMKPRISTTDSSKPLKSDSPGLDSEDGQSSQDQADGVPKNGSDLRSSAYGGEESDDSASIEVP